ncbi:MAG: 3-coathanger stack domain-containing protein [Chitinophagaceae bacterium]
MYHKLFILLFIFGSMLQVNAQQDEVTLAPLLKNKRTLREVMQVIDTYYTLPATKARMGLKNTERSYKHWKRWEYWWSSRVGPNGEFVNVSEKMLQATGLQQNRKLLANASPDKVESVGGNWSLVGPTLTTSGIGRVDRIAFHPSDPDIIYAGAAGGGLWRTINGGSTWTDITSDIPCLGISGISINPNNTNEIFILTGDGDSDTGGLVEDFGYMRTSIGVLKTSDGGATWAKTGSFPGAAASVIGYRLVMHPSNPSILFACTSDGLYRTVDGCATWVNVRDNGRFFNMAFKPGNPLVCYAAGRSGDSKRAYFWRSINGGLSWDSTQAINNIINNPTSRVDLTVAPSNSNVVYLLCGGIPDTGMYKGLYRSDNSGVSFALQSNTPNILGRSSIGDDNASQSTYDLTVAVSPTSSTTVLVGGVQAWRSTNSGSTWAYKGSGIHDDIHELAINPLDNKIWAATDGGVYSSVDNGTNWTPHFNFMSIGQFYKMAVSPDDYSEMIGGQQDNGTKKRVAGTGNFDPIGGKDGYAVGYDAGNASIYYSVNNSQVNKYTGNGAVATIISPPNVDLAFFTNMAMHSTQAGKFFLGSDTFRTVSNGGSTWSYYITGQPMPLGGWALRTCPSNSNRIYMAGGAAYNSTGAGILRRSDDGGVTWPINNNMILSAGIGFPASFPKITCINVNPINSSQVWVTFGGFMDGVKVYSSSNAGLTWTDRSGSLPNLPINCVAVDNSNNAYIGTDNGVYRKSSTVNDWVPFYNNLPYVPVTDLVISAAANTIRAATFGRGIWSSDMYSPCPVNLNVAGTIDGQEFYEASSAVTTSATLTGSAGTKVRMKGGQGVKLVPPFKALANSDYNARIGPCESGAILALTTDVTDSTILPANRWMRPEGVLRTIVENVTVSNQQIAVRLHIQTAGNVEIVLTDIAGNIMHKLAAASYSPGYADRSFSAAGLPPGTYYVQAVHNHRLEHLQEVEIK